MSVSSFLVCALVKITDTALESRAPKRHIPSNVWVRMDRIFVSLLVGNAMWKGNSSKDRASRSELPRHWSVPHVTCNLAVVTHRSMLRWKIVQNSLHRNCSGTLLQARPIVI